MTQDQKQNLKYAAGEARLDQTKQRSFGLDLNSRRNLNSLYVLLGIGVVLLVGLILFVTTVIH